MIFLLVQCFNICQSLMFESRWDQMAHFLSEVTVETAAPLAHLYNLSLWWGTVPLAWKQFHITPFIRVVPLMTHQTTGRLLLALSRLKYLKKLCLLSFFRSISYSIYIRVHTIMVRVLKTFYWLQWMLLSIVWIRMNLSVLHFEIFGRLRSLVLLRQLLNSGVSNAMLQWFRDYLTNRTHGVKCYHQYSSWVVMKGGIPLGPLLFFIYMNTLPSKISDALLLQYADDITLVCSGADPATTAGVMNQQLASIYD